MYSVLSAILTFVITTPLSLLVYSDILVQEVITRKRAMDNIDNLYSRKLIPGYRKKMKIFINIFRIIKRMQCPRNENFDVSMISTAIIKNDLDISYMPLKNQSFSNLSQLFDYDSKLFQSQNFNFTYKQNKKKPGNGYSYSINDQKLKKQQDEFIYSFGFSILALEKNEMKNKTPFSDVIRKIIKYIIILGVYVFIWLYLLVIILSIYNSYGTNFFKICVMPLISMLFIQLVIVANALLFISSLLLYYYEEKVSSTNRKTPLIIIFNLLVPPNASSLHQSISMYRKLIDKVKNNKWLHI